MQDIETVRKVIETELKEKTDRKVRNVFFLCRSAGDFRSIYCIRTLHMLFITVMEEKLPEENKRHVTN